MSKVIVLVIGALFAATLLFGVPTRSAQAQSPDLEGADPVPATLTITKVCPNGNGDSDADFNILVMKDEAGIAADVLECNEALTVSGLAEGVYRISELITGPDAASFATTIACLDAAGQLITLDANGDVVVEAEPVKQCAVINLFNAPAPPAADETDDGTDDGTNVSTNTHSNSSRYTSGGLDNYNVEHNSNTTTNSQQEQNDTSSNNGNSE